MKPLIIFCMLLNVGGAFLGVPYTVSILISFGNMFIAGYFCHMLIEEL